MSAPTIEAIHSTVHRRADEIIAWTMDLIRFASENRPPDGAEGPVQEFIAQACRQAGLQTDVFAPTEVDGIERHPWWLSGRRYDAQRKNVVATWPGTGGGKSVLFSGHSDVAPYEPDNWQVCRPFEPIVKDGRLYGRGSADMKAGLAAGFWAIRVLQELDFSPAGDVMYESVVDEEFASGNGTLAARLRGHNADLAVVTEPTGMTVCPACFGAFLGDLTIRGRGGMPYTGEQIANPITGAARAVQLLDIWQSQWRDQHDHPLFQGPGRVLNTLVWRIDSSRPDEFTQMGTPLETRLSWIVWCLPGTTEDAFQEQFQAFWRYHHQTDPALLPFELELTPTYHFVRPWETLAGDPGVQAVVQALQKCGSSGKIAGGPFSCDLAVYGQVGGMPAVLLGPRCDNLHGPDEWVLVEDILTLTSTCAALAASWCGPRH